MGRLLDIARAVGGGSGLSVPVARVAASRANARRENRPASTPVPAPEPDTVPEPDTPTITEVGSADPLGAICRRAKTWPQAVALLLDARGVPNGGAIGDDFFDALDALHGAWDLRRGP